MTDPQHTDHIPGTTWTPRAYRNLKIAVIVMAVLLVVGFMVVFATIIARLSTMGDRPADAPVAIELTAEIARLLGPDSELVSTSMEANRLAIVLRRAEGLSVIIIDMRSGEVVNVIGADGADAGP